MKYFALTHKGLVRERNEDYILTPVLAEKQGIRCNLARKGHLFIVSDGVGGHKAGGIASETAARHVLEGWYANPAERTDTPVRLTELMMEANEKLLSLAATEPAWEGMATTQTALVVKGSSCTIAHIGDSRAYLYRNSLLQLTEDHSPVWSRYAEGKVSKDTLRTHPDKHYISRALGFHPDAEIDILEISPIVSGIFLLCSDGLTDLLPDRIISQVLSDDGGIEIKGRLLLEMALLAGGPDNISLILIEL